MSKTPYRRVSATIWLDVKFKGLSDEAKLLWFYFLTPPGAWIPGVIGKGKASISESMGWSVERFSKRFGELFAIGLAKADFDACLVWLPNAIQHNKPDNRNQIIGWSKLWKWVPDCPLKIEVSQAIKPFAKGLGKPFEELFPIPMSNQINNKQQTINNNNYTCSSGDERLAFDFESVYRRWPKKAGKKAGMDKAKKLIRTPGDFEKLKLAVDEVAKNFEGHSNDSCPHWSTFINQERWNDEEQAKPTKPYANGHARDVRYGHANPPTGIDYTIGAGEDF